MRTTAFLRINADNPKEVVIEVVTFNGKVILTSNRVFKSIKTARNHCDSIVSELREVVLNPLMQKPETVPIKQKRETPQPAS